MKFMYEYIFIYEYFYSLSRTQREGGGEHSLLSPFLDLTFRLINLFDIYYISVMNFLRQYIYSSCFARGLLSLKYG